MAAYAASGAAVAEAAEIDVTPQGNRAAAVTVRWRVRAGDGTLLRDFRTTYQFVGPDPWRVVTYVNHDEVPPAG
jgi:hypothetical protein